MYNDILKIGPLTIHGYGLLISIGIVCALLTASYRAKKKDLNKNILYDIAIIGIISGFASAKLLFCIVEFRAFLKAPLSILSSSGFVVYGGIIGAILSVLLYCKWKKVSFLRYFDLAAPSIALAQGFGRIGCFLAGCCYGRETGSFIGIAFHNSSFAPNGVKLIPTQLISSAGDFLISPILILFARKSRFSGMVGALYLVLYSAGRFFIEFLRDDSRGSVGVLSTSQFLSLILFGAGIALSVILRACGLKGKEPAKDTQGSL